MGQLIFFVKGLLMLRLFLKTVQHMDSNFYRGKSPIFSFCHWLWGVLRYQIRLLRPPNLAGGSIVQPPRDTSRRSQTVFQKGLVYGLVQKMKKEQNFELFMKTVFAFLEKCIFFKTSNSKICAKIQNEGLGKKDRFLLRKIQVLFNSQLQRTMSANSNRRWSWNPLPQFWLGKRPKSSFLFWLTLFAFFVKKRSK